MWIVRFEMVSPIDHPQYYEDETPSATVQDVLPHDWKAVAVVHQQHPDAVEQFRGLKELARTGELVRNIKLRPVIEAEVLRSEVVQGERFLLVTSGGQDQRGQDQHAGPRCPEDGEEHTPGDLPDPARQ